MHGVSLALLWRTSFSRGTIRTSPSTLNFRPLIRISWSVQISRASTRRSMATIVNVPRDPNTLSNYHNWRCNHITANFDILFHEKKLVGSVTQTFQSATDGESQEIVLDSNHVNIGSITLDGRPLAWELLPPSDPYGRALKIKLDRSVKKNETIDIEVCASPESNPSLSLTYRTCA